MLQYKVAVIESDPEICGVLVEVLTDAGFLVATAPDPKSLSGRWHGDVIVTDTFTSPYSAADVGAMIRELKVRSGAAVVLLSAHGEAQRDSDRLGSDAFLAKPFEIDSLIGLIQSVAHQTRKRDGRT